MLCAVDNVKRIARGYGSDHTGQSTINTTLKTRFVFRPRNVCTEGIRGQDDFGRGSTLSH